MGSNEKIIDKLTNFKLAPLPGDSPYMKPFRFHFEQNGRKKNWGEKKFFEKIDFFMSSFLIMQPIQTL
jgi:hypothetical protein